MFRRIIGFARLDMLTMCVDLLPGCFMFHRVHNFPLHHPGAPALPVDFISPVNRPSIQLKDGLGECNELRLLTDSTDGKRTRVLGNRGDIVIQNTKVCAMALGPASFLFSDHDTAVTRAVVHPPFLLGKYRF